MSESFLPDLFATFEDIPAIDISLKGSAEQMGITEGVLRYRLRKAGRTFQACKEAKQMQLFVIGHSEGLRGYELATHVGFSEKNSLFRAVKRWLGVTYKQYAAKAA